MGPAKFTPHGAKGHGSPICDSLAHFQAHPDNRNPWNTFFGPILMDQLVGFTDQTRQVMKNAIEMKIKEILIMSNLRSNFLYLGLPMFDKFLIRHSGSKQ